MNLLNSASAFATTMVMMFPKAISRLQSGTARLNTRDIIEVVEVLSPYCFIKRPRHKLEYLSTWLAVIRLECALVVVILDELFVGTDWGRIFDR